MAAAAPEANHDGSGGAATRSAGYDNLPGHAAMAQGALRASILRTPAMALAVALEPTWKGTSTCTKRHQPKQRQQLLGRQPGEPQLSSVTAACTNGG